MKELCSNCQRPAKGRWLLLEPEGWTYYRNDVEAVFTGEVEIALIMARTAEYRSSPILN